MLNSQLDNTTIDHHGAKTSVSIIPRRSKTDTFRPSLSPRAREGKLQLVARGRWSATTLSLRGDPGFGSWQRWGPWASPALDSPRSPGQLQAAQRNGEAVTSGRMPSAAHHAWACTTTLLTTMDLSGESEQLSGGQKLLNEAFHQCPSAIPACWQPQFLSICRVNAHVFTPSPILHSTWTLRATECQLIACSWNTVVLELSQDHSAEG